MPHTKPDFETELKKFLGEYWLNHGPGLVDMLVESSCVADANGKLTIDTTLEWFGEGMASK